ncbi:MAG: XRE family transcriptional regulator [Synergistales bacterium]|nr:XRE family transcriptional regulator [Synergistales bacterium]
MRTVIKKILAEKGMSVHAFHKRIGGNRTLCYQISGGFYRATQPQRDKIADALETPVDVLFDENGMPKLSE